MNIVAGVNVKDIDSLDDALWQSETILASQSHVGIYNNDVKSAKHSDGTCVITSQRLFYIDEQDSRQNSFYIELKNINKISSTSKLFMSSAKIILDFNKADAPSSSPFNHWACHICGYMNQSNSIPLVCGLCGVAPNSEMVHKDSFLLERMTANELLKSNHPLPGLCPVCTYKNHRSLGYCEMCHTSLLASLQPTTQRLDDIEWSSTMKLSFRMGGDRLFRTHLESAMLNNLDQKSVHAEPKMDSSAGITNVISRVDSNLISRSTLITDTFRDLDSLGKHGTALISVTNTLELELRGNARCICKSDTLSSNGVVMKKNYQTQSAYLTALVKEMSLVLYKTSSSGKVIALDELWAKWNRCRGTSIIPLNVLELVINTKGHTLSPPVQIKTFQHNNLQTICPASFDLQTFVSNSLDRYLPCSAHDFSKGEDIPIRVSKSILLDIELETGLIMRDEDPRGQLTWFSRWPF